MYLAYILLTENTSCLHLGYVFLIIRSISHFFLSIFMHMGTKPTIYLSFSWPEALGPVGMAPWGHLGAKAFLQRLPAIWPSRLMTPTWLACHEARAYALGCSVFVANMASKRHCKIYVHVVILGMQALIPMIRACICKECGPTRTARPS